MKKNLLTVLFLFLPIAIFASPFGLEKGMSLEEIEAVCNGNESVKVEDEVYLVKPLKSHPLFQYYAVYVNEKVGLYQIRAISDNITTNKYGTELQNAFNDLKDRIGKTYGRPKVINENRSDSYYQQDEYWFYTLHDGSRTLAAIWGENKELSDDLVSIVLECKSNGGFYEGPGILVLYYYFNNASGVEDEQDSVF